jgi:hypothetical protein
VADRILYCGICGRDVPHLRTPADRPYRYRRCAFCGVPLCADRHKNYYNACLDCWNEIQRENPVFLLDRESGPELAGTPAGKAYLKARLDRYRDQYGGYGIPSA